MNALAIKERLSFQMQMNRLLIFHCFNSKVCILFFVETRVAICETKMLDFHSTIETFTQTIGIALFSSNNAWLCPALKTPKYRSRSDGDDESLPCSREYSLFAPMSKAMFWITMCVNTPLVKSLQANRRNEPEGRSRTILESSSHHG